MPPARPMLDELELPLVQVMVLDREQVLVEHAIPAVDGNILQRLGRRATVLRLAGMIAAEEGVAACLKALRDKFRAAAPVTFVTDIASATRIEQMYIEAMTVRELAGLPAQYEYCFTLREYLPAQPQATEAGQTAAVQAGEVKRTILGDAQAQMAQQAEQVDQNRGGLAVRVTLDADPPDYSAVVVVVEGTTENGETVTFSMLEQVDGTYRRDDIPPGNYQVRAFTGHDHD